MLCTICVQQILNPPPPPLDSLLEEEDPKAKGGKDAKGKDPKKDAKGKGKHSGPPCSSRDVIKATAA